MNKGQYAKAVERIRNKKAEVFTNGITESEIYQLIRTDYPEDFKKIDCLLFEFDEALCDAGLQSGAADKLLHVLYLKRLLRKLKQQIREISRD